MICDFNAARLARGLAPVAPPTLRLLLKPAAELRRWRCFEARLTQAAAAELARISPREWQRLETGRALPRAAALRALEWAQVQARVST